MRLLMLCVVSLISYGETSQPWHTGEDVQVAENVTVTLCPDLHLCQNMGCGTSWIRNSACQCDWACEFFDDCCLDFASVCSSESSEVYDSLTNSQFECISQTVQRTSYSSVTHDFWMVSNCPYAAEHSKIYVQIRENCETTTDTNPLTLIPVTDASNITFRNIYCALCHGRPTSELVAWRLEATCQNPHIQSAPYGVFLRTVWNECDHFLVLPAVEISGPATRRPCIRSLISTCSQHDPQNRLSSCQNFTAVVKDSDDGSLYRNPACFAACKGSQLYSLKCPVETFQMVHDQTFPVITETMTRPNNKTQDHDKRPIAPPRLTPVCCNSRPVQPPVLLSVILDFNPDPETQEQCQEGDLFDPFSQTCLSPQCEEGLEYVASEQRCEPVNQPQPISIHEESKPTNDDTFRCLGDSNQGTGILFIVWTTLKSTNPTGNPSNTETGFKSKEQCIRDLLDVNLTSVSEADHSYSGNSSQFAFNILLDGISENDEKVKTNDTETEVSISRQKAIDSIVEEIENKLQESAKTNLSQCGIQITQIVQFCSGKQRNPFQATLCSPVGWHSLENETQIRVNNQTVWAFDSSHDAWYRLLDYNLRIQYKKQGSVFKKLSLEIGPCSEAPKDSCPAFIKLSESQFSLVDEDTKNFKKHANGSLIFLQTGEILEPGEFTRTEDEQIIICATKLPKNGTQFFNFNNAQAILSTIGLIISVAAGSVSLVTYLVFPSLHVRTRKAIMGMVTSLIAAQTLLLLSGIASINDKACMAVAVTGHFLWLASLTWTNVLAFLLWNTFSTKNPSPSRSKIAVTSKVNILSSSYALGVPLAIVIVCLIIHFCSCTHIVAMYDNQLPCWIKPGLINLVVFGAPMALFLVINILLFVQTVWAIRSSHRRAAAQFNRGRDKSFLQRRSKELFIYVRMASLMGFTWVFGFSAAFSGEEALWYLFIILNSLQGFFIFLSFTFSGQVKKLWVKRLMSIRGSVLTKTSVMTSRRKSRTTTSSISAGITASDTIDMSSNNCTSTTNDSCLEASIETSSRFKKALKRLKEKSTQRSEPTTGNGHTKPSTPVKEDDTSSSPLPSYCHASAGYEVVIPERRLQGRDDEKQFWHKSTCPRPKHTTPSLKTAEYMTTIKEDATSSSAGPSICLASSPYEEVIPGRCLKTEVDDTRDSPTSSKSANDTTTSNNSDFYHHGKSIPHKKALSPPGMKPKLPRVCSQDNTGKGESETGKQVPKIPLLPSKIPRQSKTSVPEKTIQFLRPCQRVEDDKNAGEQLPSRLPDSGLEKESETKPNCKVRCDKPAILPRVNLETEGAQTKDGSYHNPSHHNPQLIDKEIQDTDKKVHLAKPLPPPRPKPRLQGMQEAAQGGHPKPEVKPNATVHPSLSSYLKGEDSISTPTVNPNLVDTSDDKTDINMNHTQKILPSVKPPLPPRSRPKPPTESRDESGWHDVIGQIKGQSILKSN